MFWDRSRLLTGVAACSAALRRAGEHGASLMAEAEELALEDQDEILDDLPLHDEHLTMDSQATFSPEIIKLMARTLGLANLFIIP